MNRKKKKTPGQQTMALGRRVRKKRHRAQVQAGQVQAEQDGRWRSGLAPSPEYLGPTPMITRVLEALGLDRADEFSEDLINESSSGVAARVKLRRLRDALDQSPGGQGNPHTQEITSNWIRGLLKTLPLGPPTVAQPIKSRAHAEKVAETRKQKAERKIENSRQLKNEAKQSCLEQSALAVACLERSLNHGLSDLRVEFAGSIFCQGKNKQAAADLAFAAWNDTAADDSSKLVMCTDASGNGTERALLPCGIAVTYKWTGNEGFSKKTDRVSGLFGSWEAELVGIIYALRAALGEFQCLGVTPTMRRAVLIFSDSDSALRKLANVQETQTTKHPLIFAAIAETRPLHHLSVDIELRWMPRNTNVGHSLADALSKEARVAIDRPIHDLRDILGGLKVRTTTRLGENGEDLVEIL